MVPNIFYFHIFSPLFGEDSHFDEHVFQMGWFNHQLEIVGKVDFGFEKIPNFIPMGRKVYLPIHEWLIFYGKLVGKYTMDGMGRDHS